MVLKTQDSCRNYINKLKRKKKKWVCEQQNQESVWKNSIKSSECTEIWRYWIAMKVKRYLHENKRGVIEKFWSSQAYEMVNKWHVCWDLKRFIGFGGKTLLEAKVETLKRNRGKRRKKKIIHRTRDSLF